MDGFNGVFVLLPSPSSSCDVIYRHHLCDLCERERTVGGIMCVRGKKVFFAYTLLFRPTCSHSYSLFAVDFLRMRKRNEMIGSLIDQILGFFGTIFQWSCLVSS